MLRVRSRRSRPEYGGRASTERHHTATAFLLRRRHAERELRLVLHPRHGLWVMPGGHVEPGESPAQTVRREILEETGLQVRLVPPGDLANSGGGVPEGEWTVEMVNAAEPRSPIEHVHIDHLHLAVVDGSKAPGPAELDLRWVTASELDGLPMVTESQRLAGQVMAWAADSALASAR